MILVITATLALVAAAHDPAAHPHPGAAAAMEARSPIHPSPLPAIWTESTPLAAPDAFAPALRAHGGELLATWIEPAPPGGPARVLFAAHRAGRWSPPTVVRESRDLFANWADTPGVAAAADGALYAWWLEKSAESTYAYDVRLARSSDGGATFRPLGIVNDDRTPSEHGFVSAVAEGDGVRLFYLDGRATGGGRPMQLRSALVRGDRIEASELVDDSVCDCCPTSAVATAEGAAVAFRDRARGEIRDIQVARRRAPGGSGAISTVPVAADRWRIEGCPVNGPALAAGLEGGDRLAIAWYTAANERPSVSLALSTDEGRSFGAARRLDGERPIGRVALTAVPSGFVVAWLARTVDGAALRVARVDSKGNVASPSTVALVDPGRRSGIPRLATVGETLWLAWTGPEGRGLRFASAAAPTLP